MNHVHAHVIRTHTDRTLHGSLITRILGKITRISRIYDKNSDEVFSYDDKKRTRLEIDTNEKLPKKIEAAE